MSEHTAENDAPGCEDVPHGADDCGHPENHWPRVIPPSSMRLGSCCVNVGTDACTCENPTNWGSVIPPAKGTS